MASQQEDSIFREARSKFKEEFAFSGYQGPKHQIVNLMAPVTHPTVASGCRDIRQGRIWVVIQQRKELLNLL